jgi:uncharacterized protein
MASSSYNAWCRSNEGGAGGRRLTLILHVQPGAKRTEVVGLRGDPLKIRARGAASGRSGECALLAFLAEVFGVPQRQVMLKQGNTSRRRVMEMQAVRGPEALFKKISRPGKNQSLQSIS